MFSDGARIVDERMRLPPQMRCVHWMEEWAEKRDSLQGRISWIESGTTIGPVERNEEYQESRSNSPMIILGGIISDLLYEQESRHTSWLIQPCSMLSISCQYREQFQIESCQGPAPQWLKITHVFGRPAIVVIRITAIEENKKVLFKHTDMTLI